MSAISLERGPNLTLRHFLMDILHVATELAPFAKVGGLADVVAALTKHLKIQGHKVTLVLPRFP